MTSTEQDDLWANSRWECLCEFCREPSPDGVCADCGRAMDEFDELMNGYGELDVTEKEQVLCFPARLLEHAYGFEDGALVTDPDEVRDYLCEVTQPENLLYIDRESAELDPDYLQVIPYTVLIQGRTVFRYQRSKKGGEGRLYGLHSVGVGGHINPGDGDGGEDTYDNAFYRELEEEVGVPRSIAEGWNNKVVGLLYDPSTPVGAVHFGVVHFLRLPNNARLEFTDEALTGGFFQHQIDLKTSEGPWETWSKLVIEKLL